MNILIIYILKLILFPLLILNNYQLYNSISLFNGSFIQFTRISKSSNLQVYKYIDEASDIEYNISRKSFNNGLVLFNLERNIESQNSELRVVIEKGYSFDKLEYPGIRYFSLHIFSLLVDDCLHEKNDISNLKWEIISELKISIIKYSIKNTNLKKFFKCFVSKTKIKNLRFKKDFFNIRAQELTNISKENFKNSESINIDRLFIQQLAMSRSGIENKLLKSCNNFLLDNYKDIKNLNKILSENVIEIINKSFLPSSLILLFSGNTNTDILTKYLSNLTKDGIYGIELEDLNDDLDKATKSLDLLGNNLIYRHNINKNLIRFYIPFMSPEFDTISSNSQFFFMNLLNSRHSGGIVNFLLINGLVDNILFDYYFEYKSTIVYSDLKLTEKGTKKIPLIIDSFISYINLIVKSIIINKTFLDSQKVLDEFIALNYKFLLNTMENYINIYNIYSLSVDSILESGINTNHFRCKVERFISSINLDSITISISLKDGMNLFKLLPIDKIDEAKLIQITERCTGEIYTVIDLKDIYDQPSFSTMNPNHSNDIYGLTLPNNEPINLGLIPNFVFKHLQSNFILLHDAIDIHYNYYIENNEKNMTISQTMVFKSFSTSNIWYSNNRDHKRSINLRLKMRLREWDNLMIKFEDYNPKSIIASLNIIAAILNERSEQIFGILGRFNGYVKFIPTQLYIDSISESFELFLLLNCPVEYLTFILEQVSDLLNSIDQYFYNRNSLENAIYAADEALNKYYNSMNITDRNIKIITQAVSSLHTTKDELHKEILNITNPDLLHAVSKSILSSPILSGSIDGNISPFQANHALNIFIESLNHIDFLRRIEDGPAMTDNIPICMRTVSGLLDVSSVPLNMRKVFIQVFDNEFIGSSVSIVILVGLLNTENYAKSLLIKEIYQKISEKISIKSDKNFNSRIIFTSNRFFAVELILSSKSLNVNELTEFLYNQFTYINKKLFSNLNSRNYSKKILSKAHENNTIFIKPRVYAEIDQDLFIQKTNKLLSEIDVKNLKYFLQNVIHLPTIIIATQGKNVTVSSTIYIPQDYVLINSPKELLESAGIVLFY